MPVWDCQNHGKIARSSVAEMAAASVVVDPLRAHLPSVSSGSILLGVLLLVS